MTLVIKKIKVILIFILITLGNIFAENYAVLISAGKTIQDDRERNSEYWYDLFLMYEVLKENGFTHDNIHVLYGDGTDFQSYHSRYQVPGSWGITQITDRPNTKINIQNTFYPRIIPLTDKDFLWVWWMGHGSRDGPSPNIKLLIKNRDVYVTDDEFASYVDVLTNYKRRSFSFAACHSEGMFDDLENNKTVILVSSPMGDFGSSIETDVWHAEFNDRLFSALKWKTPGGSPINADYNSNGLISMQEGFDYCFNNKVYDWPMYKDLGGIGQNMYIFSSGHITRDTHFLDDIDFTGNIYLDNGVNLNIDSDIVIKLEDNVTFNVNGTLNASGTEDEPIKFTSINENPSPGDWMGIIFESGSSGIIEYCNIHYADKGIRCNSQLPNIRYNLISNNNVGIYCINIGITTTSIYNNEIRDNNSYGIYLNNSSPFIGYNDIRNNGYYGINCYRSYPSIYHNDITSHSSAGVYCNYYSPVYISYYSSGPGINLITGNYRGVYANYQCNAFIYWNDIYGNSSYEVDAYSPLFIDAEYNWWGAYPPNSSEFRATYGATIDYTPALSSPVGGGKSQNSGGEMVLNDADCSYWDASLDSALQYQQAEKYDQAIEIYERTVKNDLNSEKGRYALVRLDECYRLSAKKGFISYLDNSVRPKLSRKDELFGVTLELENHWRIDGSEYKSALENLELLRTDFSDNAEMEKYALFNIGFIYLIYLNNRSEAEKFFSELESKYPDDPLVLDSKIMLGNDSKSGLSKPIAKKQESDLPINASPVEYSLTQNYPNPFNPTTTIKYALPYTSQIHLAIYNILGQRVGLYVLESQASGNHTFTWNGKNQTNADLPSGLYFVRFRATSLEGNNEAFEKSMKVTLLR